MRFDILKSENSPFKEYHDLYNVCIDMEKCVNTSPLEAVLRARLSEERFVNAILDLNGIKIPDDLEERKKLKLDYTANKIKFIFEKGFIDAHQLMLLNAVRKAGNLVAMQQVEDAKDINAVKVFEFLYEAIKIYIENT